MTSVSSSPKVRLQHHIQVTQQQHNPRVRMLTNSKGVLKDTSLIGNSPAHCSTSSCSSIVADFAYAPSVECHSWNSCSQSSVLEQEVKIAEGVCPQDHLLQAAQEVTSESGYITRKSDLEYLYLSRENTTFPSVHGSMSTKHPDWLLALPAPEHCTSSPSKGKSLQQCTLNATMQAHCNNAKLTDNLRMY